MKRGFLRLKADMSLFYSALFGNFFISLILGSVFYNLPSDTSSFYSREVLLFYAVLLAAFASALEVCQYLHNLTSLEDTQLNLTLDLDPDPLCPASNCGKAIPICLLPPFHGSGRIYAMRCTV